MLVSMHPQDAMHRGYTGMVCPLSPYDDVMIEWGAHLIDSGETFLQFVLMNL